MHLKNLIIYGLTASVVLLSCKKESQPVTTTTPGPDPHTCTTSNAPGSGDIISGRYIVAYNQTISARGLSASRLEQTGETVLERNGIPAERLQNAFGGAPGGFIADLSP